MNWREKSKPSGKLMPMTAPAPRPITAITFDLGNVLVRVDHLRFCRRLAALTAGAPRRFMPRCSIQPGAGLRYRPHHLPGVLPAGHGPFRGGPALLPILRPLVRSLRPHGGHGGTGPAPGVPLPLFLLSNTNSLHFDYIKERFGLSWSLSGPSSCLTRWAAASRSRPSTSPSSGRWGAPGGNPLPG